MDQMLIRLHADRNFLIGGVAEMLQAGNLVLHMDGSATLKAFGQTTTCKVAAIEYYPASH